MDEHRIIVGADNISTSPDFDSSVQSVGEENVTEVQSPAFEHGSAMTRSCLRWCVLAGVLSGVNGASSLTCVFCGDALPAAAVWVSCVGPFQPPAAITIDTAGGSRHRPCSSGRGRLRRCAWPNRIK